MANPTLNQLVAPAVILDVAQQMAVGDLIGYDTTNNIYTKADADTSSLYAQFIAVAASVSSGVNHRVSASKSAYIEDLDAPFTANAKQFLSSTAGESTETRPVATDTSRLVQVVGHAVSTFVVHYNLPPLLREQSEYYQVVTKIMAGEDEKVVLLDSGSFASFNYNANGDDAYVSIRVPDKAVSLALAYVYMAEEAEVAAIDLAIVVASALHNAQHDAVTADSSLSTVAIESVIDADDIGKFDISTAFDATDIVRPGALLSVHINATLGGTDITALYGVEMVWNVVD